MEQAEENKAFEKEADTQQSVLEEKGFGFDPLFES
jgi:hypothetical protein